MKKTFIYARKSTESEERQIQSIEAQINWCREYANTNSFNIVEEIIESKTAKKPWREWFNKMMQLFSEKKAEVIITWQLNRLSRNAIDEWTLKWFAQEWTIKEIHSTDWISDWQNILLMSVHFWMANQYIIDLKKNVLRWMTQKFEKWGALWQAPSWYWNNKNTNEYDLDQEEMEYIKDIFLLRAKKVPYSEISDILFKKWFKSKTWKPKSISTLQQIVSNEFYIGIIKFQWKRVEWKHQTFISKELFDEANGFKKSSKIIEKKKQDDFIFSWLLKYQWRLMRAYTTKNNIYYREATWQKPSFNISQKVLIEKIEEELPKYVLPECLRDEFSKWLIQYFEEMNKWNKNNIIQTRKRIDELREENKELVRKNIKWLIDDEMLEDMQKENMFKIKDLESKLKDLWQVDDLIDDEVVELFRVFTDSQKVFKNSDLLHKVLLLNIMLVELNFDNKKQLSIANTKLFTLIREINFLKWQSQKWQSPNFWVLFEYIKSNLQELREVR